MPVQIVRQRREDIGWPIEAIRAIPVSIIGDELGRKAILDPALRPVCMPGPFAGPALTVECAAGDISAALYAVELALPGDVLVIDARGYVGAAIWGEIMQTSAKAARVAGVLIDGAVRDTAFLRRSELALFARGVSARGPEASGAGAVGRAISCAGTSVRSGDLVVGDEDGVVIVGPDEVEKLVDRCHARLAFEEQVVIGIGAGRSAREAFGLPASED